MKHEHHAPRTTEPKRPNPEPKSVGGKIHTIGNRSSRGTDREEIQQDNHPEREVSGCDDRRTATKA